MKLDDYRTSDNVGDERGQSFGGGGGMGGGLFPMLFGIVASRFGIGGIVVLVIGALIFGGNPMALMGGGQSVLPNGSQTTINHDEAAKACSADASSKFSCQVLANTEDTWSAIFQQQGKQYTPTALIFYSREGASGCGAAQSAMGPFYCPNDKRVYLDTEFYDELQNKFGVSGNFAQAYVIAHEVGHHVQDEMGVLGEENQKQQSVSTTQSNAIQVLIELQADCYAGVWAAHNRDRIEPGDVEGGLKAAHAIGDDTLQQEAQGRVVPDSFTHGTSAERMKWLKRGIDSGDPAQCDTFKAGADG